MDEKKKIIFKRLLKKSIMLSSIIEHRNSKTVNVITEICKIFDLSYKQRCKLARNIKKTEFSHYIILTIDYNNEVFANYLAYTCDNMELIYLPLIGSSKFNSVEEFLTEIKTITAEAKND